MEQGKNTPLFQKPEGVVSMSKSKEVVHLSQGYGVACGLWGEKGIRSYSLRNTTCKQCKRTITARKMMMRRLEGDPNWMFENPAR